MANINIDIGQLEYNLCAAENRWNAAKATRTTQMAAEVDHARCAGYAALESPPGRFALALSLGTEAAALGSQSFQHSVPVVPVVTAADITKNAMTRLHELLSLGICQA